MKEIDRAKAGSYDSSSMQDHEGMKGVRIRPAMYIKAVDIRGVFKMFLELVQNVVDEFNAGRCSHLRFEYDSSNGRMTITDNGCGLPLDKVFSAITKLHSGGKFNNEAYQFHAGQNGVGLTVCNALSTEFEFLSHRDGKYTSYKFEKGERIKDYDVVEQPWKGDPYIGVRVSLIPDATIFDKIILTKDKIEDYFDLTSSLNNGLQIDFIYDGKLKTYNTDDGLKGLLIKKMKEHNIRFHPDRIISIKTGIEKRNDKSFQAEIAFTITDNKHNKESSRTSVFKSFVNNMETDRHGQHVTGFRSGLTKAINQYMKANDLIPKNLQKYDTSAKAIRDYISAIVTVKHSDPQFDGQTKEELTSPDIEPFVNSITYQTVLQWLNNNTKDAKAIVDMVLLEVRATEAAKAEKNRIMSGNIKTTKSDDLDLSKFRSCQSKNAEECELIIVEGDSAAGNVNSARNSTNQALLLLSGKITNILKDTKETTDASINLLIKQLGCGIGATRDINKLKYHKIIVLTDADDDGAHIQALLITFFYTYFPELIERGHIYTAQPPLKVISMKQNNKVYDLTILDDRYNDFYLKELIKYKFDLISDKTNKPLSKELFDLYIRGVLKYGPIMRNKSNQLLIHPSILEFCIIYYHELINGNYKRFNKGLGIDVRLVHRKNHDYEFEFDSGTDHYFMCINDEWRQSVLLPLIDILSNKVKLNSIHFKYKADGTVFHGTHYQNFEMMNRFFDDDANIRRFKGLGEMPESLLHKTVLDRNTRRIVRVTMEDVDKAEQTIRAVLGKDREDIINRKEIFKERMARLIH